MKVLLDTNVLSEVRRPAPEPKVLAWLDAIDEDRTFISVASIAELRRGIALMEDGRRRAALAAWLARSICRGASPGEFCRSIRRSPRVGAM
jgi:toxin FitB